MKKIILLCWFTLFVFTCGFSGNRDLFQYDKTSVEIIFYDLNELENYINSNEGITISSINNDGESNGLIYNSKFSSLMVIHEPVLGIPSFLWGCLLGLPGLAIVHFIADDKNETKKAFSGCLIGFAATGLTTAIIRGISVSNALKM